MVGDVGQDGGAAWGDAVSGEEKQEAGEEVIDGGGGCEFAETGGEGGGEIGGLALIFGEFGVAVAERRVQVGRGEAAAGTLGEAVLTTA